MMSDTMLQIGATVIRDRLKDFDGDLEARVRFAMSRALTDDTWYTGNSDEKMRAALGGAMLSLEEDSEDRLRLERSIEAMRDLSALLSGAPIDAEVALARAEGTLPIAAYWGEAVEGAGR